MNVQEQWERRSAKLISEHVHRLQTVGITSCEDVNPRLKEAIHHKCHCYSFLSSAGRVFISHKLVAQLLADGNRTTNEPVGV